MMTQIMAIVNLTDDSFSGDGWLVDNPEAWRDGLRRYCETLGSLAHVAVIDIGAESTRPGSEPLPVEQELDIVGQAMSTVADAWDGTLSIDTYKPEVGALACDMGASMINDVTGQPHPEMWKVAAEASAELVLMHNTAVRAGTESSDRLGSRFLGTAAADVDSVLADLQARAAAAAAAGVDQSRVIVDPGLGFGKSVAENFELIRECERFVAGPNRVLYGPSRKSFLGWRLDRPVEGRDPATSATVGYLAARNVDLIRVHNAEAMSDHLATLDAIEHHSPDR